jgi:hypothetical protein
VRTRIRQAAVLFICLTIVPAAAYAQASIAGVVRDASGAVLPGVTVEASSPALIEKVRTVVTDGTGQYRIENLRPGAYAVTLTLSGFATVTRAGIALTGSFVATVNADLRVGEVEETIQVTGETPVVDVQSTTHQTVLDDKDIDLLPASRATTVLAQLIPAVVSDRDDVGGTDSLGRAAPRAYGVNDTRMFVGGIGVQSGFGGGATGTFNAGSFAEVTVDTAGISAESKEGGVRINLIPRYGGNAFSGRFYGAFANESMQGTNVTPALTARGLPGGPSLRTIWDVNPSFGGPMIQNKLWFYVSTRSAEIIRWVPAYFNKNEGDISAWTYEPDFSRQATADDRMQNGVGRATWQATRGNKIDFSFDYTLRCECPQQPASATQAPETSMNRVKANPKRIIYGAWTNPRTNRLLFEAGAMQHWSGTTRPGVRNPNMIPVREQSTGMRYRGATSDTRDSNTKVTQARTAVSYVTGAHSMKAGVNFTHITADEWVYAIDAPLNYTFNNGVPTRITMTALPYPVAVDVDADNGIFVQDRWTQKRLTLSGGLRYDYFRTSLPETTIGPAPLAPTRNITVPASVGVKWHDISPRGGVSYDVFGDGKTSIKASLNKYLTALVTRGIFGDLMAPSQRLVTSATRSWNDANRNYVPDCNLLDPALNGECGALSDRNFGGLVPAVNYDPAILSGLGVRGGEQLGEPGTYWQFTAGVQRELLPRVAADVTFVRTSFGNFTVQDDRNLRPADFSAFSITAPIEPRLPGGGGYVVSGLVDVNPAKFGQPADNIITFADDYGKQTQVWTGVDVSLSARARHGLLIRGGTSSGRQTTDNCEILAALPEMGDPVFCQNHEKLQTTVKFSTTYTVPRIDVQLSGTYQDLAGRPILANYTALNAQVAPSLGRNLAGTSTNTTVPLVAPGQMFGDRVHQVDVRVGKILRYGGTQATVSVDVYNVLNANPVRAYSATYATWLQPQSILPPRFAKVVLQLDF